MPRIRQYEQKYAETDFLREVRSKQGYYDFRTQEALGQAVGLPKSTMRKRLIQPDTMTVKELRSLVKVLNLDPLALLKFLGYSGKDINKVIKEETT